jgi:hypothetical protein
MLNLTGLTIWSSGGKIKLWLAFFEEISKIDSMASPVFRCAMQGRQAIATLAMVGDHHGLE